MSEAETSLESYQAMLVDADRTKKIVSILMVMFESLPCTPDEIAVLVKLTPLYTKPRLTELRRLGLIERVGRGKSNLGRASFTLRLMPDFSQLIDEAEAKDRFDLVRAIFLECEYVQNRAEEAQAVRLLKALE